MSYNTLRNKEELLSHYVESAIDKIRKKISVTYQDAELIGHCIAHTYFEIEGDADILVSKFDLDEVELSALTKDEKFFMQKYEEKVQENYLAYYGE